MHEKPTKKLCKFSLNTKKNPSIVTIDDDDDDDVVKISKISIF